MNNKNIQLQTLQEGSAQSNTKVEELKAQMLDSSIALLKNDEHPIVHSDRGCHYRWPGRIKASLGNMSPKKYRQKLRFAV